MTVSHYELVVHKGELKLLSNPGGAFNKQEMEEMYNAYGYVLLDSFDDGASTAIKIFNVLSGRNTVSTRLSHDNLGWFTKYMQELFLKYVDAVKMTMEFHVVVETETKSGSFYVYESDRNASIRYQDLCENYGSRNVAHHVVSHLTSYEYKANRE